MTTSRLIAKVSDENVEFDVVEKLTLDNPPETEPGCPSCHVGMKVLYEYCQSGFWFDSYTVAFVCLGCREAVIVAFEVFIPIVLPLEVGDDYDAK